MSTLIGRQELSFRGFRLANGSLGFVDGVEYNQVGTLNSELSSVESRSAQTLTTIVTVVSTPPRPSLTACGTFTYTPRGDVAVESVEGQIVNSFVYFNVTVENVGYSVVEMENYVLNTTIGANSPVLHRVPNNEGLGISVGVNLEHGQSYSLYDPTSGDGYWYEVAQPGRVNVTLSFPWTETPCVNAPCTSQTLGSNTTTISAQFTFP